MITVRYCNDDGLYYMYEHEFIHMMNNNPDKYNSIYLLSISNINFIPPKYPSKLISLKFHKVDMETMPLIPNNIMSLSINNCNLENIPVFPQGISFLDIRYNYIKYLPELPPKITEFHASHNNLSILPDKIPDKIRLFDVSYNNLEDLPYNLIRKHKTCWITYKHNKVYDTINDTYNNNLDDYLTYHEYRIIIQKYFNGNLTKFIDFKTKSEKKFANKIGTWFLKCKYNPEYKYCRNWVEKTYADTYNSITNE